MRGSGGAGPRASLGLFCRPALVVPLAVAVLVLGMTGITTRPAGAASSTAPITYVPDDLGRTVAAIDPASGVAKYAYDAAGNLTSITRPSVSTVSVIEFHPKIGPVGTAVTVYGTAFSSTPSQDTVKFHGTAAQVTSATATTLTAVVPSGATSGTISVTAPGGTATSSQSFTIGATNPAISGFSPTIAAPGTSFTITGSGFDTSPMNDVVAVNAIRAQVTAATSTSLTAVVPPGVTSGHVSVRTSQGKAVSSADLFVPPPAQIKPNWFSSWPVGFTGRTTSFDPTTGIATGTVTSTTAATTGLLLFDGTEDQRVSIVVHGETFGSQNCCDVYVTVLGPDGSTLAQKNWYGHSDPLAGFTDYDGFIDTMTLPIAGTYSIVVQPVKSTATGSVSFTLYNVPADLAPTFTPSTAGSAGSSNTLTVTTPGQNVLGTFSGTVGERVSLQLTGGTGGLGDSCCDTGMRIEDPDGLTVGQSSCYAGGCGTTGFLDTQTLAKAGAYTVVLDPLGPRTGTATLTLYDVPPDLTPGFTPTATGSSNDASITVPGQNFRGTFPGTVGELVSLKLSNGSDGLGDSCCDSNMRIEDPDGVVVGTSTPCGVGGCGAAGFLDTQTLAKAGTYTVVLDPLGPRIGSATLTLYDVPSDVTAPLSINGSQLTLTTWTPGQNATATFPATVGQALSLSFTTNIKTICCHVHVSVQNPDGSTLVSPTWDSGTTPKVLNFTIPTGQGGTDTVIVDPDGALYGSTTLTLTTQSGSGAPAAQTQTSAKASPSPSPSPGASPKQPSAAASPAASPTPSNAQVTPSQTQSSPEPSPSPTPTSGTSSAPPSPSPEPSPSPTGTTAEIPSAGSSSSPTTTPEPSPKASPSTTPSQSESVPRWIRLYRPPLSKSWTPSSSTIRTDNWQANRPMSPWQTLQAPAAPSGVTAISGQVLALDGTPIPGVSLSVGAQKVLTDNAGMFLLTGVSAGRDDLVIDGRSASTSTVEYGVFEDGVDVTDGQTTVLPYTIWMPALDTAHEVQIQPNATRDQVVSTPLIPGLELHIPPGSTIKDMDGNVVTKLGITPIPIDQPPFPLPSFVQVPTYFTIQPGGSYIYPSGAYLVYPNYTHLAPGTRVGFWNYDPDPDAHGWSVYGQGTVTPNGSQIVPDPTVRIYELTGAMIDGSGLLAALLRLLFGKNALDGDPIDLASGLFDYEKTDLYEPGPAPIAMGRVYRQLDIDKNGSVLNHDFGVGMAGSYDLFLYSESQAAGHGYTDVELVLPGSTVIQYTRIDNGNANDYNDAVFQTTQTPSEFYGSTITYVNFGWNLTMKDGTILRFGDNAPLQSITDRFGNSITLSRPSGSNGLVTQISSTSGRWVSLTYNGDAPPHVSQIQDNSGRIVKYTYYANGDMQTATTFADPVNRPNGETTTYNWQDPNTPTGITSIVDPRNITFITNKYDSCGRVQTQTLANGGVYQFAYTPSTGCSAITQTDMTYPRTDATNPSTIVRRVAFNSDSYPVSDIRGLGSQEQQTTTYTRQPTSDLVTDVIDQLGRDTHYDYDQMANVKAVTLLYGTSNATSTSFTYEPVYNRPTAIQAPMGRTSTFAWDDQARSVAITDARGTIHTAFFNRAGDPKLVQDGLGHQTQYGYDLGDLTSITDPLGRTTATFIDSAGRVAAVTDAMGERTIRSYDNLDRLTKVTDPLGGVTTLSYDVNGDLTLVKDPRQNASSLAGTSFAYNNMDLLKTRTDPLNHPEAYSYDLDGNLIQFTDRRGKITKFKYDHLDRQTFAGFGAVTSGGTTTYTSTIDYTLDGGNRLRKAVDSLSGTITRDYTDLDQLQQETTPQGSVGYTYDAAGRRWTMTVAGQPQVTYDYYPDDLAKTITQGTSVVAFGYDGANRPATLTLPNNVVQGYTFDASNQLTDIAYTSGQTSLGDLHYGYDGAGNRTGEWGSFARVSLPAAQATTAYDAAEHLTTWGTTNPTYTYDGDLKSDGTNTYTWNDRDQLSSITGGTTASFSYDPFGRRTTKTVGSSTTNFLYDGNNVVQELSATNSPTANLLTGLGLDQVFSRTNSSGVSRSFLTDALGSTLGLTDSSGTVQTSYTYEPFGKTSTSGTVSANAFQFTGRENDGSTGMYYLRARYYSPAYGRFISEDPAGFAGGINLQAYVNDAPVNRTDPLGLGIVSDIRKGALGFVELLGRHWREVLAGIVVLGVAVCIAATDGVCGASALFDSGDALGGVTLNRAVGLEGEAALRDLVGGESEYFSTSLGGRFVDSFSGDVSYESKVGWTAWSARISSQIAKDAEIIESGQAQGSVWVFTRSPTTGMVGASPTVLDALANAGIQWVIIG